MSLIFTTYCTNRIEAILTCNIGCTRLHRRRRIWRLCSKWNSVVTFSTPTVLKPGHI